MSKNAGETAGSCLHIVPIQCVAALKNLKRDINHVAVVVVFLVFT